MANEKRLIDAKDAVKMLRGKCVAKYPSTFLMGLLAASTEIEQMPTVDAVPVVRCQKCNYGHWLSGAKKYACRHPLYTGGNKHSGEHFCSYSERRQGE